MLLGDLSLVCAECPLEEAANAFSLCDFEPIFCSLEYNTASLKACTVQTTHVREPCSLSMYSGPSNACAPARITLANKAGAAMCAVCVAAAIASEYDKYNTAIWSTGVIWYIDDSELYKFTYRLDCQSDGNVVLYNGMLAPNSPKPNWLYSVAWATDTCCH
jgi:hypothetical protein